MIPALKVHPLGKIINQTLKDLPTPSNITIIWNLGSLLGLCLRLQLLRGILLSIHYTRDIDLAFNSLRHIIRDVNNGWLFRVIHANGGSFFFICLYLHVSRGIYFNSYLNTETWIVGVLLLLIVIATAFLGYVLPWGQISFWGATVITNLFSAIPIIGEDVVLWLWGGFAVDKPTLTRFFSLHFLIPFIVLGIVGTHLLFLHQKGSNNPLGLKSNIDKIIFHPYFSIKDLLGLIIIIIIFFILNFLHPWMLGDPENFIPANPLVTPIHIQPEWYFLFAYAILRSIPNKLGGVIALAAAVIILAVLPLYPSKKFKRLTYYPLNQIYFWILIVWVILLTWIGARPVESPYILIGQILTVLYFSYFFIFDLILKLWDFLLS